MQLVWRRWIPSGLVALDSAAASSMVLGMEASSWAAVGFGSFRFGHITFFWCWVWLQFGSFGFGGVGWAVVCCWLGGCRAWLVAVGV